MISFKTYDFGTYALLNDRHAHMPFQTWRMRPKSTNDVLFTLHTQSFQIVFEVQVSSAAFYFVHTGFIYSNKAFLSLEKQNEKKIKKKERKYRHTHARKRI